MRAVTSNNGQIAVITKDISASDGELITVTSSGICGSDLHMVSMGLSGVVLGHEFGGYTSNGQLVAIRPTGQCGSCVSCQRRHSQTCETAGQSLIGLARDGGLAQYARVDQKQMYSVPNHVPASIVGLVEPLAVVTHGINRARLEEDMTAIVVGAGSIGLLTGAVLRDRGVQVDIVARHPHQQLAAEKLGLGVSSHPTTQYDVSFDAVCTQQSFDSCVTSTRPGGQLVEFGMFWTPVQLNNHIMLKEIDLLPSIFYGENNQHDDFAEAIDYLARHCEIADTIITHTFPLAEAEQAFAVAQDKSSGAIKVQILPEDD